MRASSSLQSSCIQGSCGVNTERIICRYEKEKKNTLFRKITSVKKEKWTNRVRPYSVFRCEGFARLSVSSQVSRRARPTFFAGLQSPRFRRDGALSYCPTESSRVVSHSSATRSISLRLVTCVWFFSFNTVCTSVQHHSSNVSQLLRSMRTKMTNRFDRHGNVTGCPAKRPHAERTTRSSRSEVILKYQLFLFPRTFYAAYYQLSEI